MAKATPKKTINKINNTMPKTNSKTKKTVQVIKKLRAPAINEVVVTRKKSLKPSLLIKLILVVIIGVVVFLLVQKYKNVFIVGTVNKSPITRWELNQKMAEKYATQTFEELVSERLLAENLAKNKIVVTEAEVQTELTKIKSQYGGEEQFKAAIVQFGMTEEQALTSIKQSIGLKKLIESTNKIVITDEQVAKYFADNAANYTGKKLDEVKAEIQEILLQQEIYTKSQEWYSEIRKAASVSSFL